jgi:hypothetical protein
MPKKEAETNNADEDSPARPKPKKKDENSRRKPGAEPVPR